MVAGSQDKLGKRYGTVSLVASRRKKFCWWSDVRLLAFRTVRGSISVASQICGNVLHSPSETHADALQIVSRQKAYNIWLYYFSDAKRTNQCLHCKVPLTLSFIHFFCLWVLPELII
jgi:hypothetical protein